MTDSTETDITGAVAQVFQSAHQHAILRVIHELGAEHSLEKILDELDGADRKWVLTLRPVDLVPAPSPGSNGHAPGPVVPPVRAPAPAPAPARASKPRRELKAKKAAAKKPAKAAKKPASKKVSTKKPAKPKPKPAARAAKSAAPAPAAAPPTSSAGAAAPRSQKAQVAEAVAAYVGALAKGTRFKTADVLTALGATTKDTAKRVKVVAALREFEESKKIANEGSGRASSYVVT